VCTSADEFGPNSKARPHAGRVHSKKVTDIDEGERPIVPLGCDPAESFPPLAARYAGAASLDAPHGVFEYCRHESYLGEARSRSTPQKVGRKLDEMARV
jgi:hypothetical protein